MNQTLDLIFKNEERIPTKEKKPILKKRDGSELKAKRKDQKQKQISMTEKKQDNLNESQKEIMMPRLPNSKSPIRNTTNPYRKYTDKNKKTEDAMATLRAILAGARGEKKKSDENKK